MVYMKTPYSWRCMRPWEDVKSCGKITVSVLIEGAKKELMSAKSRRPAMQSGGLAGL